MNLLSNVRRLVTWKKSVLVIIIRVLQQVLTKNVIISETVKKILKKNIIFKDGI
jgi:hypothetical protein